MLEVLCDNVLYKLTLSKEDSLLAQFTGKLNSEFKEKID